MEHELQSEENIIEENRYSRLRCIKPTNADVTRKKLDARIRARHKTRNSRLRIIGIIIQKFHYNVYLHCTIFNTVVRLILIMIDSGEPLFSLNIDCTK